MSNPYDPVAMRFDVTMYGEFDSGEVKSPILAGKLADLSYGEVRRLMWAANEVEEGQPLTSIYATGGTKWEDGKRFVYVMTWHRKDVLESIVPQPKSYLTEGWQESVYAQKPTVEG